MDKRNPARAKPQGRMAALFGNSDQKRRARRRLQLLERARAVDPLAGVEARILAALPVAARALAGVDTLVTGIVADERAALRLAGAAEEVAEAVDMATVKRAETLLAWEAAEGDAARARFVAAVVGLVGLLAAAEPGARPGGVVSFAVPRLSLVRAPGKLMTAVLSHVLKHGGDGGGDWGEHGIVLGAGLAAVLKSHLLRASRLSEEDARRRPERLVTPAQATGDLGTIVKNYFGSSPLAAYWATTVSFAIGWETLFRSGQVLGATGSGKSAGALSHLIAALLDHPEQPSVVVVDSQGFGSLMQPIAQWAEFDTGGRHASRLVLVDALDPAGITLNPLSMGTVNDASSQATDLLEWVFEDLSTDLTGKQAALFARVVQLALSVRGASMATVLDILRNGDNYAAERAALSGQAHTFFAEDFDGRDLASTKQELIRRLMGLLEGPFERLLTAPSRFDIAAAVNGGRVILIDSDKARLGVKRSKLFSRLVLAMVLNVINQRLASPASHRRPCVVLVDECFEIFDSRYAEYVVQIRKARAGIIGAHQSLAQMPAGMRSSLAGQYGLKLYGRLGAADALEASRDLRVKPEALLDQSAGSAETAAEFHLMVTDSMSAAAPIKVPMLELARRPQMSAAQWQAELDRQHAAFGTPYLDGDAQSIGGGAPTGGAPSSGAAAVLPPPPAANANETTGKRRTSRGTAASPRDVDVDAYLERGE